MKGPGQTPRIVIAGTGGDSGKTLVALAIARAARRNGLDTTAFKKGPDYIDAAWLQWASGRTARNLDTWLMGENVMSESFVHHAEPEGLNVIEGNRGLFDGMDPSGTHSTASLARLLGAPVILVVPVTKVTASVAAVVHGFATFEKDVRLGGVILNRVGGARHERVIREAIRIRTGIPVLGAIPRLHREDLLPDRHLGLVPLQERDDLGRMSAILDDVSESLDLPAILALARSAPRLRRPGVARPGNSTDTDSHPKVRIGVFRDAAFSFYYPENLEALEADGAELIFLSPLTDPTLPDLDALYLGGGFPETHTEPLAANRDMQRSVLAAARSGLPIYAECGGLMYLSRSITWKGETFPMAGVLAIDTEVSHHPRGHGYSEVEVDRENPFWPVGSRFRGHEFHYSTIQNPDPGLVFASNVHRGNGCGNGRCGIVHRNVFATYIHVHVLGEQSWAGAVVGAARRFRERL